MASSTCLEWSVLPLTRSPKMIYHLLKPKIPCDSPVLFSTEHYHAIDYTPKLDFLLSLIILDLIRSGRNDRIHSWRVYSIVRLKSYPPSASNVLIFGPTISNASGRIVPSRVGKELDLLSTQ